MSEKDDNVPSLSEILANSAQARIRFAHICGSKSVHMRLSERLADVWDSAVECFGDAPHAATYLLSPNNKYNQNTPIYSLMQGDVDLQYIRDDIGRIAYGVFN